MTKYFLVCLLLSAGSLFAGELAGQVLDHEGEGVHDASVTLVQLRRIVKTDQTGHFTFGDVEPGGYALMVTSNEIGSKLFDIEVGDNNDPLRLVIDPTVHEELVVSATPNHKSISDVAVAVGVLNKEDLMEKMQPTLGETLANEPGVSSTYFGPASSRPIIRGLGGDRVRMLEGGLSSGDASTVSADHAVAIEPMGAERIEILRGPAALRYGSAAVGGAVNVVDNRIPEFQSSTPLAGSLELRGATVNDERTFGVNLNGGQGRLAWHTDFQSKDAHDLEIPGEASLEDEHDEHDEEAHEEEHGSGLLENSSLENRKGSVGVSYITDRGFLGVAFTGLESNYGIPGHNHAHEEEHDHKRLLEEHDEEEEAVRIDLERNRIDLRGELRFESDLFQTLNLRLGAADYEHQELEGDAVGTSFLNDYRELRLESTHSALGPFSSGSIGLQYANREFEAIGEEAFTPANDTDSLGLYFYEEVERANWSLTLGGRYERQKTEALVSEGHDHEHADEADHEDEAEHDDEEAELIKPSHGGISSAIGFVYGRQSDYGFSVNLSRTERAPTPEALFSNGAHLATSSYEIGNVDLDEEHSLGLDITFRKKKGLVTGELSLFYNQFDNFIYQSALGEEIDGLDAFAFTQQDADFRGGELHIDATLLHADPHHLHIEFTYDTVRAELDGGANLPRITPDRYTVALEYKRPRFHAKTELRITRDQDRVAEFETPTEGYTFVNASLGYHFFTGSMVQQLLLRGTNLGDEEGRVHTSFLKDRILLPGRSLALTWRMEF